MYMYVCAMRNNLGICLLLLLIGRHNADPTPQLFRNINRNSDVMPPWFNPMTQAGVPQALTAGAHSQFDERVSDLIAFNVLRFAHDIGRQLSETSNFSKSEIFSPVSLMSALALLLLGAKGKSYEELRQLFGLDHDGELLANPSKFHEELGHMLADVQNNNLNLRTQPNWRYTSANHNIRGMTADHNKPVQHIVKVANGLFAQDGYALNPDYKTVISSVYQSELALLDFNGKSSEARDYINRWIDAKTYGKIPNIINGDIAKGTTVIMASALYFLAFWENSFFEASTSTDNFYPDGPQQPSVKVKMMATGGVFPFYDSSEYDCRIIGLPYKGNSSTMYVIQPNHSTRNKLKELQNFLDANKIEELISKMTRKSAVLAFPKMHFVRSINMKNLLNQLGIREIFANGRSDLSLIGGTDGGAQPQHLPVSARPTKMPFFIYNRIGEFDNSTDQLMQSSNITDSNGGSKTKRQTNFRTSSLGNLEASRNVPSTFRSELFVEDIMHKVDFNVNEQGTEAAAATLTYLRRSGTDVLFRADTPFLILIRHDPTKLTLFYGIINEPEL